METIFTDQNFEEEVIKSTVPVLVDFWAPWCGLCKMMGPIVEDLAKEFDGQAVKIGKLNVDENPESAEKFSVMSIPAFKFFKAGEVAEETTGPQAKDTLKEKIEKLMTKL